MRKALAKQRLIASTMVAALSFNAPMLWLADAADAVLGIPAVYLYVFLAWAGFIGVLAWLVERG